MLIRPTSCLTFTSHLLYIDKYLFPSFFPVALEQQNAYSLALKGNKVSWPISFESLCTICRSLTGSNDTKMAPSQETPPCSLWHLYASVPIPRHSEPIRNFAYVSSAVNFCSMSSASVFVFYSGCLCKSSLQSMNSMGYMLHERKSRQWPPCQGV